MEEAQRSQSDQVASGPASVVIEDGNGSGAGGEEKGGCHVMSCDDSFVGQGGGAGGGELKVEKEVVAEAMELETVPAAEVAAPGGERAKADNEEENILDLTSFQLHDLSDVDLPPTLAELDLTSNRLFSIDPRIANLSHLQVLCHHLYEFPWCMSVCAYARVSNVRTCSNIVSVNF
jgi:hypothetical protein